MFYWLVKYVLRPWFRLIFTPVVMGEANIPARGGALLASNHLSMCDSLFLPVLTRRRITFLAKQEYFTGRGLKGRATAAFVRGTGLIPLDRDDPDAARAALSAAAHVVGTGRLLAIYPEGTRSPDGRLYRGKTGIAHVALDTQVPVVPVAMIGTERVQPIGAVMPRRAHVRIIIGEPLTPPVARPESRREQARAFTDLIMAAIAALSGQEQTDIDAAQHKRSVSSSTA